MLIHGRVVDREGAPVEWASAWLVAGPAPFPDIAALTDADGRFTLTASAPGIYRVGCRAESDPPVEVPVDVGADDVEVTITLRSST